jgi:hypothetical protein
MNEKDLQGMSLIELLSEINCRIEHGAEPNGHLNFVRYQLEKIIYGFSYRCPELEIQDKKQDLTF